jgi:hypothetical protein
MFTFYLTKETQMKTFVRNSIVSAALVATLSSVAHAAYLPPSFHDFGQAVSDGSFTRVVKITPETKSIGIYRLEKIKFVDEQTGKSFVWDFDTINAGNFPLADIAPPDVLSGQPVQAYVWDVPSNEAQP